MALFDANYLAESQMATVLVQLCTDCPWDSVAGQIRIMKVVTGGAVTTHNRHTGPQLENVAIPPR